MPRSIRPYLEYQADRVEAVLAAHRAPGRITGGTVGPRLIRFVLNPAPHIRFSKIRTLADDLALAMRVPTLNVQRATEGVVLEFPNPNPRPVTLLTMLPEVLPLPTSTALLGLTDEGLPLLARLSAPEVAHVLIAGTTGSGKSALLRTIAASLVLTHQREALQMLCIDPKGRTFPALEAVPNLTRPIVTGVTEALEALRSLLRIMEIRDQRRECTPHLVLFIDELADLIFQGGQPVTDVLTRLAQRGREAGIHLVAATQHPSSAILSSLMRANFPLRLVGKVASANEARVASGRGQTNAHLLNGRGDFLAISGGDTPIRFQVAYVKDKELLQALAQTSESPTRDTSLFRSLRRKESLATTAVE